MDCHACQFANRTGVIFCESCGSKLESPCPACHDLGPVNRGFCGQCGMRLSGGGDDTNGNMTDAGVAGAPERRHLTVMFCDLVGSTDLSQRYDPEVLSDIMRSYNIAARDVMQRYEGYVARYLGDGILCYFGYPRAFEDNAERSVHAALDIVEAVKRLDLRPGLKLQTRVGIASGEVVAGEIRAGDSGFETLAIGSTPNLAARLQGLARPDTVIVSQSTRRLIRSAFNCVDLGEFDLKGYAEPQHVWQVEARSDGAGSAASDALEDGTHSLVGRERELQLLVDRYESAASGRVQLVQLVGEGGIGKTSLIQALRARLSGEDCTEAFLACSSMAVTTPLFPVVKCVERFARISPSDDDATRFEKLLKLGVASSAEDVSIVCLAQLVGIPVPADVELVDLTPRQQHARALQLLDGWVETLAETRPLVLIVEDAHWIDPTTLDWLRNLIETHEQGRILIIVSSRPEFRQPWELRANTEMVRLSRLAPADCEAIIHAMTHGEGLPRQLLDVVLNKTDGVPLFVEEVTRAVLDSGALARASGDAPNVIAVPDSLRDSLMARLDRTPWIRDIAQSGAVIGREFEAEMLSAVASRDQVAVDGALSELEQTDVMRRHGPASESIWGFKNALVRDAAYDAILHSRRAMLHGRVADALLSNDIATVDRRPELVALHLDAANRFEEAIEYWRRAAERARASWANLEAEHHLQCALAALKRLSQGEDTRKLELTVLLELGEIQRAAHGSSAAETCETYRRAAEICEQTDELASILRVRDGQFVSSFSAARLDEALAPAKDLLRIGAERGETACEVAGHQACGMHAFATGDMQEARSHFELALAKGAHARFQHIDVQFPSTSQAYLSWTLHILGESARALEVSEASINDVVDAPAYSRALVLGNACYLHQFRGDTARIDQLAGELDIIAAEKDLPAWRGVASFFSAWANCHRNPVREHAERLYERLAFWAEDEIETPYFKSIAGEALVRAGLRDRGMRLLDEAEDLMTQTGERWYWEELQRIRQRLPAAEPVEAG